MDNDFTPLINSITPNDGSLSVPLDTNISLTFTEEMDNSSFTTNTLNNTCSGSVQVSSDDFLNPHKSFTILSKALMPDSLS